MENLRSLLPKVKVLKHPEDRILAAKHKLREYFLMLHKRNTIKRKFSTPPKFTLFLEPCPMLCIYDSKDDTLPMEKVYYTSFRIAYRQYMRALDAHKSTQAKKRRASLLT
jgi:hypothetical protein